MKRQSYGFGVEPTQTANHFFVMASPTSPVIQVYERFSWDEEGRLGSKDRLRIEISKEKWNVVMGALTVEFNARLKEDGLKRGRFTQKKGTPIERLLGKEMMVLLWAIEDSEPSIISTAIRNWKGLMPEERWWLYTMTNAATGGLHDRKGWRKALKYALCENPISY